MIGKLVGEITTEDLDGRLIIDVGGVGYEVFAPLGTSARVERSERGAVIHVHTHVRETAFDLYGFATDVERRVFRLLIGVPGVGPSLGLRILSAMRVADLAAAVRDDEPKQIKVRGVGPKIAAGIVLDLRTKLPQLLAMTAGPAADAERAAPAGNADRLVGALTNMGYRPAEAQRAVDSLGDRVRSEPVTDLLRDALAALAT